MYANHGWRKTNLETILCSQNRLSGLRIKLYYVILDGKQTCVCQETNLNHAMLYGFSYGMVPSSVRRSRLAKAVPVWKYRNITKTATWMHSTNLVHFYPTPAKLGSARPNTDCLATSNGIFTKRYTARFELLLFKNKVNNNSRTWPLIHLTSLATFYSKTLLLKWVMPVKE